MYVRRFSIDRSVLMQTRTGTAWPAPRPDLAHPGCGKLA